MLKIRLRRMGSRHRPFFRVVVSDSRRTPTAASVEEVGFYDPRQEPSVIAIDADRIAYWNERGAQVSDAVKKLLKQSTKAPAAVTPEPPAPEAEAVTEAAEAEAVTEVAEAEAFTEAAEATEATASDVSDVSDSSDVTEDAAPEKAAPEAAEPEAAAPEAAEEPASA